MLGLRTVTHHAKTDLNKKSGALHQIFYSNLFWRGVLQFLNLTFNPKFSSLNTVLLAAGPLVLILKDMRVWWNAPDFIFKSVLAWCDNLKCVWVYNLKIRRGCPFLRKFITGTE